MDCEEYHKRERDNFSESKTADKDSPKKYEPRECNCPTKSKPTLRIVMEKYVLRLCDTCKDNPIFEGEDVKNKSKP